MRDSPRTAICFVAFIAALLSPAATDAQIIRSYEHLDRSAGEAAYLTASLVFDGSAGNTEFVDLDVSAATGHRGERHWLRLYPAFRVKRSDGRKVVDARSLHLRHSFLVTDRARTFAFVQVQSEASIDLDRRFLVGGGIRYRLMSLGTGGVDLGVGLMREEERRSGGEVRTGLRGANFVSVYGSAGATVLSLTAYLQPELADWSDHRILVQGNALVALASHLDLDVSGSWRREGRPPAGIEKHDVRVRVGFRVSVD